MSRRPSPSDQTRQIYLDAYTLAGLIDDALHNLDLGLAGWPESTPGASPASPQPPGECHHRECSNTTPCPVHNPDAGQHLTATERLAGQPDKAARDLELLLDDIRKACHHAARAASIVARWQIGVGDDTVKARLVAIDAEIWCQNCSRFGRHEPRKAGYLECDFCLGFRQQRKRPAPKEIWDARDARNGRLDETTITRILKQLDADRKAANNAARARQRAS